MIMWRYFFQRLLFAVPTLLVIIAASFFLMRLAPGGPFDSDAQLEPEVIENVRATYDLDKPLGIQFWRYLSRVSRGDFGPSIVYKDFDVTELIGIGLPVSLKLGVAAMILAILLGLVTGILAALRKNSWLDHTVMAIAMTGIALPSFVIAPLLALFFGLYLSLLPVAGWNDGALANMVLPVVALALPQIAVIARLMRGSILEVLGANFVRTARAKGLRESQVISRHVLKNAITPLISYLGPALAGVMTGSIVIEQIFSLPGIGRYFVQGALNRDYPVVMGIVIVYAATIIVLNLLADLSYGALDPRVRRNHR